MHAPKPRRGVVKQAQHTCSLSCCTNQLHANLACSRKDYQADAGHLRSSPEPIQSEDKAVSLATTTSNRLKGMRRRAAKLLAGIKANSLPYSQQATAQAARQGGAGSDSLVRLLGSMQQSAEREDIAGESRFPVSKTC